VLNHQSLAIEFVGEFFELRSGLMSFVAEPVNGLEISWFRDAVLADGACAVDYNGPPTRLLMVGRDITASRVDTGQQFLVHAIAFVHELTLAELNAGRVIIQMPERVAVNVQVLNSTGELKPDAEVSILSASPDPLTISGTPSPDGRLVFLAKPGHYSLVAGSQRHPPIEVPVDGRGEMFVTIQHD
jgi:hypothetical protein